nr:ATP-binding protein [uncultured Rhodopila sp.]
MKRQLAGGTTRQIAAIVVVVIAAAHAMTGALLLSVDTRPGLPPEFLAPAARIGMVLRLLQALPADQDAAILAASSDGGFRVQQGTGQPPALDSTGGHEVIFLRDAVAAWLAPGTLLQAVGRESRADRQSGNMAVVVRRGEGWLRFDLDPGVVRPPPGHHWLSPGLVAWLIGSPLLIAVVSLWATRRVVSPLVRLAAATEGLSDLKDPTPVAEEGTLEVRQVAHAFNLVTGRLRRFVVERTRMLAAVSHDLRTPLTRMRLRAETVEDEETRAKMLTDIRTMESMITATLAFIREESAREAMERVDMAVLLQTICDDFEDAGAEVRYEGPLHCAASCRPQALQRALINLIDNAVKLDAGVTVSLEQEPDGFVVTIDDDGPGIPEEQKEDVFKPFFSGDAHRDDPSGSMGLGLSIVRAIVQSHSGDIELSDRVPHGLSVRLWIPWRQPEVPTARAARRTAADAS